MTLYTFKKGSEYHDNFGDIIFKKISTGFQVVATAKGFRGQVGVKWRPLAHPDWVIPYNESFNEMIHRKILNDSQ